MLLDMLLPRERRPVRTLRHQETLAPSSTNRHSSSSDKASSAPSAGGAWPRRHSSSSLDPPTAGGLQAPGRRRRGVGVPRPHHDRHDPHPADQRRDPARPLRPTTPPAPTRALALGPPLAAAVPGHPRAGPPCPNDQATEAPGTPATGGRPRPATPPPRINSKTQSRSRSGSVHPGSAVLLQLRRIHPGGAGVRRGQRDLRVYLPARRQRGAANVRFPSGPGRCTGLDRLDRGRRQVSPSRRRPPGGLSWASGRVCCPWVGSRDTAPGSGVQSASFPSNADGSAPILHKAKRDGVLQGRGLRCNGVRNQPGARLRALVGAVEGPPLTRRTAPPAVPAGPSRRCAQCCSSCATYPGAKGLPKPVVRS